MRGMESGSTCPYCNSEFADKDVLSKHIDKVHHGSGLLEGSTKKH